VGSTYDTYNEFETKFQEYCRVNYLLMHVEDSHLIKEPCLVHLKYSDVRLCCIHYGKHKPKHSDEKTNRHNTKSMRRECLCSIKLVVEVKTKKLIVKDVNSEHNHPVSEKLYKMYPKNRKATPSEEEEIIKLLDRGATKATILEDYVINTGKPMTMRGMHNIKGKSTPADIHEPEKFEAIINRIIDNPNNDVFINNEEGAMTGCFFSLEKQKEWFAKYGKLVHIDATYRVNKENYLLYVFLSQDQNLRGLPVAFCYMRKETASNMDFMYECLKNVYHTDSIEIIMIDKDLQNIHLLKKHLLLCNEMNECVDVSHNKEIEQKQPVSPKLKKVNTSCLVIGKIVANINPIGRPRIKKADRNLMHFNEKKTKIKRKKGNGSSGQSGSDDSGSEPVSQPNKKRKRSLSILKAITFIWDFNFHVFAGFDLDHFGYLVAVNSCQFFTYFITF
jgi:hypothetical protein